MENASKAMIIAGAVLIGIIIISIGVSLWKDYSEFSQDNAKNIRNQQLSEFNVKFQKYNYNDKQENYATAQDIRTIVNLANDYNNKYEEILIEVKYSGKRPQGSSANILKWEDKDWANFFNDSYNDKNKYIVNVSNEENDIVSKIDIKKL